MSARLDLDRVLARADRLPSPPMLVAELLASLERDDFPIDELARRIGQDQAIAAKVLRLANSSFFGLQGKVASLVQAAVVLGVRNLRSLAIAAGVVAPFAGLKTAGFDLARFWKHSVGVGACARTLASRVDESTELAFTAGLLHDIGRLVLIAGFASEYAEVLHARAANDAFLLDAERDILGLDHAAVGAALTGRWKFPAAITESVGAHHAIAADSSKLAGVVHCADVLANALDFGAAPEALVPPLDHRAWQSLGLGWDALRACLPEIDQQYASASQLLAA